MSDQFRNGFSIRTWRDVAAVATVAALAAGLVFGAIQWGLELHHRTLDHEKRITALEQQ